ncbi:LytR/AlgR family response regulator transcription factor [Arenicella xantha]|uniref:LytTR family transcriptional regulator n=1 Tax=Arenicella xantha TaxID=644221 RepID=A0A395JMF0_9GAMM|nr:LytTR family DNA-binding domain-containing protein [Arenicella xantha]RBP52821.1 LytTR family transcriptional regulator [Arenicella xantha]
MTSSLLKRLNEPFPTRDSVSHDLLSILYVGAFITAFLYFFKPFGLHRVPHGLFWVCFGFGLITVLFGFGFNLVTRYVLRIKTDVPSWTLWKWVVQCLVMIGLIAFANTLYLMVLYPSYFGSLRVFFGMLRNTLLIGVVPVAFSGLLIQLRAATLNQQTAVDIGSSTPRSPSSELFVFDISHDQQLRLPHDDLAYIEAMQNYIVVHYWCDGKLASQVIRATMAGAEKMLAESRVVRCHRSYFVNTAAVAEISGNAQGLKLRLHNIDDLYVPVSRTFISAFKAAMA